MPNSSAMTQAQEVVVVGMVSSFAACMAVLEEEEVDKGWTCSGLGLKSILPEKRDCRTIGWEEDTVIDWEGEACCYTRSRRVLSVVVACMAQVVRVELGKIGNH